MPARKLTALDKETMVRPVWGVVLWDNLEEAGTFCESLQSDLIRWGMGRETCPTTGKAHIHLVTQWTGTGITYNKFHELLQFFSIHTKEDGSPKQGFGDLQYNTKPHGMLAYAKKGGAFEEWTHRKPKGPPKMSRDDICSQVIDMAKDETITYQDIYEAHPVFTFFNRRAVRDCLDDHRAFRRGDRAGYEEPRFNS